MDSLDFFPEAPMRPHCNQEDVILRSTISQEYFAMKNTAASTCVSYQDEPLASSGDQLL